MNPKCFINDEASSKGHDIQHYYNQRSPMNWPHPAFKAKLVLLCICMFEQVKGADQVES